MKDIYIFGTNLIARRISSYMQTDARYRVLGFTLNSEYCNEKEIYVLKKTKRGEQETDIRPDIFLMECLPSGALNVRLSAGSLRNVSPLLTAQVLFGRMGIQPEAHEVAVVRQELLNSSFVPLYKTL